MASTCMAGTMSSIARPSDMFPISGFSASLMTPVMNGPSDPAIAQTNRNTADAVARCDACASRWMAAMDGAMYATPAMQLNAMNQTASTLLATMKANHENGSIAAIITIVSHISHRGSLADSRSASRPMMSRLEIPVTPAAMPYCTPTWPSDMPWARMRNAGPNVETE